MESDTQQEEPPPLRLIRKTVHTDPFSELVIKLGVREGYCFMCSRTFHLSNYMGNGYRGECIFCGSTEVRWNE